MASNAIVKVSLDNSQYLAGLEKSKRSLQSVVDKNFSLNGVMSQGISVLTKFAGGFAAVELATKAFNAVILEGSQTTGDFVRNGLGAANDTLKLLASSIATFDFSPFENGILSTFKRLKDLREELDALNNMMIAGSVAQAKYGTQFKESITTMRDRNASAGDKQEAVAQAKSAMESLQTSYKQQQEQLRKVIEEDVATWAGLESVDYETIEKIVLQESQRSSEEMAAIRKSYAQAVKDMPESPNAQIRRGGAGAGVYYETTEDKYTGDAKKAQQQLYDEYRKRNTEAIAGNALLVKDSDEHLKKITEEINQIYALNDALTTMQRTYNTAMYGRGGAVMGGGSGGASAAKAITSGMSVQAFDAKPIDKQTESLNSLKDKLRQYQTELGNVTNIGAFNEITAKIEDLQRQIDAQPLALRLGVDAESAASLVDHINSMNESLRDSIQPLEIPVSASGAMKSASKEGKDADKSWKQAAQSVSQMGSALQGVDNKGVNIAGLIMEAVANVALGFAAALKAPGSTAGGVFSWIAAAVAGLATMTATIASIKKATAGSYAEGGIVPGTYNGGKDSTYVYASPGEVILNRAQQNNLLSQLEANQGGGSGRTVVRGEQIYTALNNFGRRKGYGELAWG